MKTKGQIADKSSVDAALCAMCHHVGSKARLLDHLDHLNACLELCRASRDSDANEINIKPLQARLTRVRNLLNACKQSLTQAQTIKIVVALFDIQREILSDLYDKYSVEREDKVIGGKSSGEKRRAPNALKEAVWRIAGELQKKGIKARDLASQVSRKLEREDFEPPTAKTIRKWISEIDSGQ